MLLSFDQVCVLVPMMVMAAASPGPDMFYIIGQSAGQRRRQGIVAVAGIATGLVGHTLAVAAGLSSLFLHVPLAYGVLKGAGVLYLVYLAWKQLQSAGAAEQGAQVTLRSEALLHRVYLQGILINLLNPKAMLFFLGVLPQFVDAGRGNVPAQLLAISGVATATAFLTHLAVALVAQNSFERLRSRAAAWGRWPRYTLAGVFGWLAIRLALVEQPG
jgi:threonine/homoserine/homoserine lactone efflux protein